MDEFEVPSNVEVHKQPQPKHWSYPVQTKELVTALDLANLGPVNIFYMNDRLGPTLPRNQKKFRLEGWFNVLSVSWYGHSREDPHFFIGVHLCNPTWRKRINKIVNEEVFPIILRWMKDVGRLPNINSVSLDYQRFSVMNHWPLQWGLELTENKDRRLPT